MESVLIKLSGEFLCNANSQNHEGSNTEGNNTIGFDHARLKNFAEQIKKLAPNYNIGIVIGGGNFFRASKQGKQLKMHQPNADSVGMLATVMNGMILQDILKQVNLESVVLSAFLIDSIVPRINQTLIDSALNENKIIIFVGGTGNPFFTTDTNAVLRALQIGAKQIWKATKVDGIYSSDPVVDNKAKKFKNIEYAKVLENNLKIIDPTAITLAAGNNVKIRVFNVFEKDALLKASKDLNFGSTIS
ncbi:MAG: uridine monophosphate kinase [Candidatus Babeliales bacterium]